MRQAWVLAVLVAAACGAGTDVTQASEAGAVRRNANGPVDSAQRRVARRRCDEPPPAESPSCPPAASRDPGDPPPPPDPPDRSVARVTGRVVDEAGAGVREAKVVVFLGVGWTQEGEESARVRTDVDGRFDIGVAEPTGVVRCLAWGDGRAVAVGAWLALRDGDTADAGTLVCGAAAPIVGRIVLPDGTKTNGRVSVEWTDAFDAESFALVRRCVELDSVYAHYLCGGPQDFTITCLPPGRYRLRAGDDGEPREVTAPDEAVVLPAPSDRGPEAAALEQPVTKFAADDRPRLEIRGSVTRGGHPLTWEMRGRNISGYSGISGTQVSLVAVRDDDAGSRARTETAGDGSFVLAGLTPGLWRLWASTTEGDAGVPEIGTACVSAHAGEDHVTIEIPAPGSRRFRLVLPDGFSTIDDDDCAIFGPAGEDEVAHAFRDGGGLLATSLRPDATYSLTVRVAHGGTWTARARVASFTSGDETLDVRLERGLRLDGRVLRLDGTPVAGTYVFAATEDGGHADAYAGLDGTFALTGLDPGRWTLEATAPGFAKYEAPADAGTTNLRIVMQSDR